MLKPRTVSRALALVLLLGVSACAKPGQLGDSIAVNEAGLGGRVDTLCRLENPEAASVSARKECLGEPLE